MKINISKITAVCLLLTAGCSATVQENRSGIRNIITELKPLGFWLGDEGKGQTLPDRSGSGNHAHAHNLTWHNGMLNFDGSYQWVEIPNGGKFNFDEFTVSLWVFARDKDFRREGMLLFGNTRGWWRGFAQEFGLLLRDGGKIELISGGKRDVFDSLGGDESHFEFGVWQHIAYTYSQGSGKLFVNSELIISKSGIDFQPADNNFLLGNDASWWMLHPPGTRSLNGTMSNIALFDKSLSAEQISRLQNASKPSKSPELFDDDDIVIANERVDLDKIIDLDENEKVQALKIIDGWQTQRVKENADVLIPILAAGLDNYKTRYYSVSVLAKIDNESSAQIINDSVSRFIEIIGDQDTSQSEKNATALAISQMKPLSGSSISALAAELEGIIEKQGARIPKVEDIYRNAIIRQLLDTQRRDTRIRRLLSTSIAKPVLNELDISSPQMSNIRTLAQRQRYRQRYIEALELYLQLPASEREAKFFSHGDDRRDNRGPWPNDRAYTPASSFDGYEYTVGSGQPWEGAHRITQEQFEQVLEKITAQYPEAKDWRPVDAPNLFRVEVHQTNPAGEETSVLLEGDWFIFDGTDEKNRGWSICVDKDGYLHLFGGQHNTPRPPDYIPGSWERLGLSRERGDEDFPTVLYWKSQKPGDITTFEFAGKKDSPVVGDLPNYFNYMNFTRDANGEIYVYGRINVSGIQSWGLYHYCTEQRRWNAIGGYTYDVISDAERAHPDWRAALKSQFRGSVPTTPTEPVLVWAWQPHFYNYCRSQRWGVLFDITGRMHIRLPIRGLDENIRIADSEVYAYSDDGGKTFRRANGAPLRLPLTVNPAPAHNADVEKEFTEKIWNLWQNLLKYAGY